MVELADTTDLSSVDYNIVRVQIPLSPPLTNERRVVQVGYVICFIVGTVIGTLVGVGVMCLFSYKEDDYKTSMRKEISDTDDKVKEDNTDTKVKEDNKDNKF